METGETAALQRMSPGYYVTFFSNEREKPVFFTREEAIAGMDQSVHSLLGAKKRFENRIIRLKDRERAIVFYEQIIEKDQKIAAKLFTIENWEIQDGQWVLIREIEEPIL